MGVLRYLALGWDVPNIAAELELSPHTVRTHLANVRSKLGVRQRVQAVRGGRCAPRVTGAVCVELDVRSP